MLYLHVPRSPLMVVFTTIGLLITVGALLLLSLICDWLDPFWSRTIILLQGLALLVAVLAYRWRPSRRLLLYPFLLAVVTYLWDPTLPPNLADDTMRLLLPLVLLGGMVGDVLVNGRHALPFTPRRMRVYGEYVNLDEAALFFRVPPDVFRLYCMREGRTIISGRTGEAYIALNDVLVVIAAINRQIAEQKGPP